MFQLKQVGALVMEAEEAVEFELSVLEETEELDEADELGCLLDEEHELIDEVGEFFGVLLAGDFVDSFDKLDGALDQGA